MGLLDGKRALVTGVANKNSIAWGIARALHAQGAQIAFTCLETNVRRVKKLAPEVNSSIIIPCNVQKDEEISQVFEQLNPQFDGKLDILVHSIAYARIEDLGGEFINVSRSGWNLALDVSAYSLVAFARAARPMMNAAGGGSIITLTFVGGEQVVPGYNVMGVAKAALDCTVRYLAYDLGPDKIRVNAISPGPIPTLSSMAVEDFNSALALMEERSPLLRNDTVEDVGASAVFLASDLSKATTGLMLRLAGGMHIMAAPTAPRRRAGHMPEVQGA